MKYSAINKITVLHGFVPIEDEVDLIELLALHDLYYPPLGSRIHMLSLIELLINKFYD